MDNELIKKAAEILAKTGKKIQENPEEQGVSLRNTVKSLQELTSGCDNPHLIYLSYFLALYIDDVWCNIAMDSTSQNEITDENVRLILSFIGKEFVLLANHLSKEEYQRCYEVYVDLVDEYLQWIISIKEGMEVIV